jgi:hypothetical protein
MQIKGYFIDNRAVALIIIALGSGIVLVLLPPPPPQESYLAKNNIGATIYSASTCGCCFQYKYYLQEAGVRVEYIENNSANSMEMIEGIEIPKNLWSCHVTLISSYAVVGHIPIEAIDKLLIEKPEIVGISLPGMPSGSPGMSGMKEAPFEIHQFEGGQDLGIFMIL